MRDGYNVPEAKGYLGGPFVYDETLFKGYVRYSKTFSEEEPGVFKED